MIYGTACGNMITDINGRSHTVTACVQSTGFRDFRGYEIYEDDMLTCGGVVLRPFFSDTENMWILTDSACGLRPDQILPLSRRIIAMFRLRIYPADTAKDDGWHDNTDGDQPYRYNELILGYEPGQDIYSTSSVDVIAEEEDGTCRICHQYINGCGLWDWPEGMHVRRWHVIPGHGPESGYINK